MNFATISIFNFAKKNNVSNFFFEFKIVSHAKENNILSYVAVICMNSMMGRSSFTEFQISYAI